MKWKGRRQSSNVEDRRGRNVGLLKDSKTAPLREEMPFKQQTFKWFQP
ncbi:hypothetical protein [Neobacillus drentensis]